MNLGARLGNDVSVVVASLLHTVIIARNFCGYSHFVGGLLQKYCPMTKP